MSCNLYKKALCVLLSGMFFFTTPNVSCAMQGSNAVVSTEQNVVIRDIDTTEEGDVIIEVSDKSADELDKSNTCVRTCSMRIVKIFETANVIMKVISSMTVYGGTATIISKVFCENEVLYFICAGVIVGVVEPIIKKIYNVAKENAKEDKSE